MRCPDCQVQMHASPAFAVVRCINAECVAFGAPVILAVERDINAPARWGHGTPTLAASRFKLGEGFRAA